jgi:hypothetical protein
LVVALWATGVKKVEPRTTGQHIDLDGPHDTTLLDSCSGLLDEYALWQMLMWKAALAATTWWKQYSACRDTAWQT